MFCFKDSTVRSRALRFISERRLYLKDVSLQEIEIPMVVEELGDDFFADTQHVISNPIEYLKCFNAAD